MITFFTSYIADHLHASKSAVNMVFRRNLALSVMVWLAIGIQLVLLAVIAIASYNTYKTVPIWYEGETISVFINKSATDRDIRNLLNQVRSHTNVKQAKFISNVVALQELQKTVSEPKLVNQLDSNPLPHTIDVTPTAVNDVAILQALVAELAGHQLVDAVLFNEQRASALRAVLALGSDLALWLIVLLTLGVMCVVGTMVRLELAHKGYSLDVAYMLGATNAYARRPFVYLGVLHGVCGALVALALLLVFKLYMQPSIMQVTELYRSDFTPWAMRYEYTILIVMVALALGLLAAVVVTTKYLIGKHRAVLNS